jgi:response regulator RpfG family c-di-GMP phosphodiesterase
MEMPCLLFVDDEPNVLKSLQRIFIDDDFEVELAESGEVGLELLQQKNVELILSDYNMPGMDGVEFLQRAREIQPKCIRMLITGRGDMEVALQAINKGQIYKYFPKPWEDEDIHISVIRALEFVETQKKMREQEQELAGFKSYRQTMVTVSHYINNFNCGLMMSLESLIDSTELPEAELKLANSSLKGAEKIAEVLRILNQLEDIKTAEYPCSDGMIDIEKEVQEAIRKIEEI